MMHCRARLSLVGDQVQCSEGRWKSKNKTFLIKENQDLSWGSVHLPLVGPEQSQINKKEILLSPTTLPVFQAHCSMRICL